METSPARLRLRRLVLGLLCAVALGCGGRSSQPTGPTQPVSFGDNDPARVTAIGDSITAGNEEAGTPYPSRLEAMLRGRNPHARVNNRGVGGQRTTEGLASVNQALAVDRPGFLLIMEGTNDVRTGLSVDAAANNLREMVRRAKGNQTVPVLATVPRQVGPSSNFEDGVVALNTLIRRIAADERIALADVFSALPDASFFIGDGLHPNDKGNQTIAEVFDQALTRAGYPAAQFVRRR
ncbi:MAG TPA: SGNH/GDSL hydrolase family protein [Methylomirabilota bacterium]|jgi:lysophospholipase L1-like esterase|nr:SGNH/GDSL hydrolase family protein [Methylomirabilota bacterium]